MMAELPSNSPDRDAGGRSHWEQLSPEAVDKMYARKELAVRQPEEDLLKENPARWVILPIKFPSLWSLFKVHEHDFWTAEDLDYNFSWDVIREQPSSLFDAIRDLVCYEAVSDREIYQHVTVWTCGLLEEIQIPEARAFLGFECAFNTIHQELNANLLRTVMQEDLGWRRGGVVTPTEERGNKDIHLATEKRVAEVLEMPEVRLKKQWAVAFLKRKDVPFAEKLLLHVLLKSVFLSTRCMLGHFTASSLPKFSEALCRSIRTDRLHGIFAAVCYRLLRFPLPVDVVRRHVQLAVLLETDFAMKRLPIGWMDVDKSAVRQFIEYVGDSVLSAFGDVTATTANPFGYLATDPNSTCALPDIRQYMARLTSRNTSTGGGKTDEARNAFSKAAAAAAGSTTGDISKGDGSFFSSRPCNSESTAAATNATAITAFDSASSTSATNLDSCAHSSGSGSSTFIATFTTSSSTSGNSFGGIGSGGGSTRDTETGGGCRFAGGTVCSITDSSAAVLKADDDW